MPGPKSTGTRTRIPKAITVGPPNLSTHSPPVLDAFTERERRAFPQGATMRPEMTTPNSHLLIVTTSWQFRSPGRQVPLCGLNPTIPGGYEECMNARRIVFEDWGAILVQESLC